MNPLDEFVGLEEFSLILALESGAVHLKRLFLAFYDLLSALSLQHALRSRGDEAHPEEVHHQLYLEAHVSVALHHEAVTEHPELLLDERLERRQVQRCVHLRVRDLVQRDLRVLQVYLRVFLQPEKRKLELLGIVIDILYTFQLQRHKALFAAGESSRSSHLERQQKI